MTAIPRGQTVERRAYMKAYCAAHPPRDRRAYKAAYDAAHQEQTATYRLANAERLKAQKRAYYQAHRAQILTRVKTRALANPLAISVYHAEHYAKNTARIKANVSAYRAANPEKKAHLENRRRARKAGNGGSHTLAERLEKFAQLGNVCYYCGASKPLTVDHAVPLSRGGTDDISNVLPACRSCNSRKNKKTVQEYFGRTNHQRTGGVGGDSVSGGR